MIPSYDSSPLVLTLPARPSYLHVARNFAESSAAAYGLGKEECLKLGLAVEEIFIHLAQVICPGEPLEIRSVNGTYYARILFRFAAGRLNMSGLNIATTISCEEAADLEEMGLMLASRSVEHLQIDIERDNRICLSLTKEKAYPEASAFVNPGSSERIGLPEGKGEIFLEAPDSGDLKLLASAIASGKLSFVPPFFRYPGKVVDMVASGEYRAVAALNARKDIVGGAFFRLRSEKIVEIYGPYVFGSGGETPVARLVLEECIGRLARTKALGLLSLWGLPPAVRESFELLGTLDFSTAEGPVIERPSFYRHLHEDPGSESWAQGDLASFLRSEYDRLVLARDIRIVQPMGETKSGASLFAADIDRGISEAILRPVWPGDDMDANVERHVHFLRSERFLNIFFELDLGMPWHAELMPSLTAHGFKPRLLLPFGGKSDVIVFQYYAES